MISASPYHEIPQVNWGGVTDHLLARHPLKAEELVEVVLSSWEAIFQTRIGPTGYRIGVDIEPQPQIMGFLLHELIPLEFQQRYPGMWCRQRTRIDKDLVSLADVKYSVEIKTSSNPTNVFGNRSYAQPSKTGEIGRKGKAGYYLTVNFEKFTGKNAPKILMVRFGWLDHADWIPQTAATGQQARLTPAAYKFKLRTLFPS
ncbi:MAG: ScaI family restriction endonuclease [Polyangiaceae bacterium]|nr:ScaI family restriction endonuclease [Polyangiaceae bacterium]